MPRIQDDLYLHVNQEWLDNAVIPDDKPATGAFNLLDSDVEKLLIADFNKLAQTSTDDANLQKAVDLFGIAKNVDRRNSEGISPLLGRLQRIYDLHSIDDLCANIKDLWMAMPLPFGLEVSTDMKQSTKYALFLDVPSTILPDTTYYAPQMQPQHDALIGVWSNMVAALLARTPLSSEEQATYLANALKFDAIIATLVKSREELADYTKLYNPMPTHDVLAKLAPFTLEGLMTDLFGKLPEQIIVMQPKYLDGFATLFNEQNFELFKSWSYIKRILSATSLLSEELRQIGSTYSNMLTGVKCLPTIEVQAYRLASHMLSEPVGLYYGRTYFGEEAKKDIVDIVKEIIAAYKLRVQNNSFLSPATKQKAIAKLDAIVIKMGYPDKVDKVFDKMSVDKSANLLDTIESLTRTRIWDSYSQLFDAVDRSQWVMPGHMVNACYNPSFNDITFPAAILQPPFYSIKQTRSQNLGGIGAVIGHEISHAFDNNGAKFDENGNLNNWWTEDDFAAFNDKTKDMIDQFDGIELPWGKVNATLTVSENIADNGGMAVTLQIMSNMPDANYQEYFINWARVWCIKARPEYQQLLLSIDVHGPAILRANMPPRNFAEWYKAFDVKDTDQMYIPEDKRVVIW